MARQQHGFDYECEFISRYGLRKDGSYTGKFDAYKDVIVDGVTVSIPVQIKYIKSGNSVDCGDYFLNANRDEDFILVVAFYKGDCRKEHILKIDHLKWNDMLKYDKINEMKHELKAIPLGDIGRPQFNQFNTSHTAEYNKTPRLISLRFKKDSKNQQRIQCAINYNTFVEKFITMFPPFDFGDEINPIHGSAKQCKLFSFSNKKTANVSICWSGPNSGKMFMGTNYPAGNHHYVTIYLKDVATILSLFNRYTANKSNTSIHKHVLSNYIRSVILYHKCKILTAMVSPTVLIEYYKLRRTFIQYEPDACEIDDLTLILSRMKC
jgi:hypothetical protein